MSVHQRVLLEYVKDMQPVEEMDDPHICTLIFSIIVLILFLKLYLYPIAGDC